jgi:UDPglucose 6-dehydrogenase
MKKASVVGLGFIGLAMAVHVATKGHDTIASSNEKEKVEKIANGHVPFFEPDIEQMLRCVLKNKKLEVVHGRENAVLNSEITFVTVGTPSRQNGSCDLTYIKETAKEIGKALKKKSSYHLIVIRSTVPPGTTELVLKPIIEQYSHKKIGDQIGLAMNPEFLREGNAMHDVANPDRVVIGEFDKKSGEVLENFSRQLFGNDVPILRMNLASAELSKYASNVFLATKISFINEVSNICERLNKVDVNEVANAMGLDPRIGKEFLKAGSGWGGSCFPKDTRAMVHFSRKMGYSARLTKAVIEVNVLQAKRMVEIAEEELGNLRDKKVALLGLSFKPDTDDVRDAPSMKIIDHLLAKGSKVAAYDPVAKGNVRKIFSGKVDFSESIEKCLMDADCCMIVTEWAEFRKLNPAHFTSRMRNPLLIDGRRIYNYQVFSRKLRFRAIGLGKS